MNGNAITSNLPTSLAITEPGDKVSFAIEAIQGWGQPSMARESLTSQLGANLVFGERTLAQTVGNSLL